MAQGSGGNSSKYGGFGGGSFDPRETSPKEKKKDEGTLSRSKWDAEDDGFGTTRNSGAILAQCWRNSAQFFRRPSAPCRYAVVAVVLVGVWAYLAEGWRRAFMFWRCVPQFGAILRAIL